MTNCITSLEYLKKTCDQKLALDELAKYSRPRQLPMPRSWGDSEIRLHTCKIAGMGLLARHYISDFGNITHENRQITIERGTLLLQAMIGLLVMQQHELGIL